MSNIDYLRNLYVDALNNHCIDIAFHMPYLLDIAQLCRHVTEFGVRYGCSTLALLLGVIENNGRLMSYDINPTGIEAELSKLFPDNFSFIQADTSLVVIENTDMLFIDTYHTYGQLMKELTNNHEKVASFIVLHDTELFGHVGEDGGPGLKKAVLDFIDENSAWRIFDIRTNCNGLITLVKEPRHESSSSLSYV
ncbi:MAG: hypothetical protein KatS3mg087_1176 [Patescibacteria group bacterium]|nr:MAG: hypothetical protein KatS3mg087_1176 [Patescibacteria group bacterium]